MLGAITNTYGNPSSIHYAGREARKALDEARHTIAKSIHATEKEIIFTSGGTEGDNLALIGTALAHKENGTHIITSQIEHHAVLKTCEYLETQGFEVTYLPVDEHGIVSVESVQALYALIQFLFLLCMVTMKLAPFSQLRRLVHCYGINKPFSIQMQYKLTGY